MKEVLKTCTILLELEYDNLYYQVAHMLDTFYGSLKLKQNRQFFNVYKRCFGIKTFNRPCFCAG